MYFCVICEMTKKWKKDENADIFHCFIGKNRENIPNKSQKEKNTCNTQAKERNTIELFFKRNLMIEINDYNDYCWINIAKEYNLSLQSPLCVDWFIWNFHLVLIYRILLSQSNNGWKSAGKWIFRRLEMIILIENFWKLKLSPIESI